MLNANTFLHENLLERTLQAYSLRAEVIQNNIANNETAGFKKSQVTFEDALKGALKSGKRNIELDNIMPGVVKVNSEHTMRVDGNNVDIEAESIDHYNNSVKFDSLMNAVNSNFNLLNMAMK